MKFLLASAILVVLLASIVSSEEPAKSKESGVRCYVCNEKEDASCGDNNSGLEKHAKDCQNGEKYCRKVIQFGE